MADILSERRGRCAAGTRDLVLRRNRHDPRLLFSTRDTAHLVPGVAAWLEPDVTPAAVRRALTADLPPEGVRRPAALLAHRLAAQLPPPPPFRARAAPQPSQYPQVSSSSVTWSVSSLV